MNYGLPFPPSISLKLSPLKLRMILWFSDRAGSRHIRGNNKTEFFGQVGFCNGQEEGARKAIPISTGCPLIVVTSLLRTGGYSDRSIWSSSPFSVKIFLLLFLCVEPMAASGGVICGYGNTWTTCVVSNLNILKQLIRFCQLSQIV